MRIAFAGNPNSGKTTMYNALTGHNENVGNWAGVTVEKKQGTIKRSYCGGAIPPVAVDLPGAYSMSPFTSEESITHEYIKNEAPDVIVNIVDATNLSRSLFFTTQLLELGIPVVIALNKSDINKKKQTRINAELLSQELGCPVVMTVSASFSHTGLDEVVKSAMEISGKGQTVPYVQGDIDLTDKAAVENADRKRFEYVNALVKRVEKRKVFSSQKNFQDKVDRVLTNRWLGIPIFAAVMLLVFRISQSWLGVWIADGFSIGGKTVLGLVPVLEIFQEWVRGLLQNASPLLSALLVDGVIGGVVAVVGFLPLVMVMYFLLALLEDCGYMSRVAVVLDPIFKKVGLSGKSVIPFVIAVGCAVPGVMASRTIKNERERRAAAMLAPFMPCGAKIPVISLFAGAFFGNAGWVSTVMYLMGIVIIFFGALIINRVTGNSARKPYFIIEIPEYKFPSIRGAVKSMCSRGWAYVVKAATIILLCNTAVQIMQSFNWKFGVAQSADSSILASVAQPFAYLFVPVVGVVSWQLAAAAITGFIAKENVVGTLAVCFVGLENLIDAENMSLIEGAGTDAAGVMAITKAAALAYLMFNLYSPPCFAAIGAMSAEMKSAKWLLGGIGLQLGIGYTVAYMVYTVGTLVSAPETLAIVPALCGLAAILVGVTAVVLLCRNTDKKIAAHKSPEKVGAAK